MGRVRRYLGLVIVLFVILFLITSYVSYSNYAEALKANGSWNAELVGGVFLTGGTITVVVSTFKVSYDSTPEIPSYSQFVSAWFKGSGDTMQSLPWNQTFVTLRVLVKVQGEDLPEKILLDDEIQIAYSWAGSQFEGNQIGGFSYDIGPEIANHENSPVKVSYETFIDGRATVKDSKFLTIPEMGA